MTDTTTAFRAGIDAIVADNSLTGNDFNAALRTVLTDNFDNAEAGAWRDAIAAEYARVGLINNPTYNNLRGSIISAADADEAEALFVALSGTLDQLPEAAPAILAAVLIDARADRDNVAAALTRLDDLIAAEPSAGGVGKLVKEIFRSGKEPLRQEKERLRDEIRQLTGDPDS